MSTTNTDHSWFWYIRQKEETGYIGIFDEDGAAPSTAGLNIDIWGWATHTEITTDSDTLPIPAEFELGFIKGCANELLQMQGSFNSIYNNEYQEAIKDARSKKIMESEQPIVIKPLDFRDDE